MVRLQNVIRIMRLPISLAVKCPVLMHGRLSRWAVTGFWLDSQHARTLGATRHRAMAETVTMMTVAKSTMFDQSYGTGTSRADLSHRQQATSKMAASEYRIHHHLSSSVVPAPGKRSSLAATVAPANVDVKTDLDGGSGFKRELLRDLPKGVMQQLRYIERENAAASGK